MSKMFNKRDDAKVKDKKGRNTYPFVKVDYTEEGNLRSMKKRGGKVKSKKKSFPDVSGDGKITKKDILMARGVIKKPMKKKKK
jgi:hypothetical protein